MLTSAVERCVMRKGSRVFGLLGRATPAGLAPFGPNDFARAWAVTADHGSLRLERLSGDEETTGLELFLPTAFSRDYGIAGAIAAPTLTRAVFGLLPSELDDAMAGLRRGAYPQAGFSPNPARCAVCSAIIPAGWPHVVVSSQPLYGNVICLESFFRILVSSVPAGRLASRFPSLLPVLKGLMTLVLTQRAGVPYHLDILKLSPTQLAFSPTVNPSFKQPSL